jgi:Leucine-rich repeat (LRR) protein
MASPIRFPQVDFNRYMQEQRREIQERVIENINAWSDTIEFERRAEVRERVLSEALELLQNENNRTLDLSNLNLTSLPVCFSYPQFTSKISEIDLAGNAFSELPNFLCTFSALQVLDLSNNKRLSKLPENFGNLTFLKELYLYQTLNEDEPLLDPIQFPQSLTHLNSLRKVNVSGYSFNQIPNVIFSLRLLTHLAFRNCNISSVPYLSLGELPILYELDLSENIIEDLSGHVECLSGVGKINFSCNPISMIANNFFNLTDESIIYLQDINIHSEMEWQYIQNRINEDTYSGPFFVFSEEDAEEIERSIDQYESDLRSEEEILAEIYEITKEEKSDSIEEFLSSLSDLDTIKQWLNRLKYAAPKDDEAKKVQFYKFILSVLEKASSSEQYQQIFNAILTESIESCGDRILLYLLKLDFEKKRSELNLKNVLEVADFLKNGPYKIDLLEKFAIHFLNEKENKLRSDLKEAGVSNDEIEERVKGIDVIEIFLGFPIALKEVLSLPIEVSQMSYFATAGITQLDLKKAKEYVLSAADDQDAFTEYLIEQDLWNSVLKENFRAQYKMIESDVTRNIEDVNIGFRRSEMLKNLTLLALKISSEVESFEPIAKRLRSSIKK